MTDFGANIFDDADGARPLPARPLPPPADAAPDAAAPKRSSRARAPRRAAPAASERAAPAPDAPPALEPAAPPPAGAGRATEPALEPERAPELAPPTHHGRHARFERAGHEDRPHDVPSQAQRRRPEPSRPPQRREPRHDAEAAEHPAAAPAAAPRTAPRPAAPMRAHGNLALLIDLDGLHEQARAQRRELAMHRLERALAGGRPVAQAIAFTASTRTPPAGFLLQPGSGDSTGTERFAAAAERLAEDHGTLLLAPATTAAHQLAARLRRAGHRVELASLQPGAARDDVRQLGLECMFVP